MRAGGPSKAWMLAVVCALASAAAETNRWMGPGRQSAVLLSTAGSAERAFALRLRSVKTIPNAPGVPVAHASALAALPNGDVLLCWWAGQGESRPDVRLYLARWHEDSWTDARPIVDRESLGNALHFAVRRIGNPALWVAADGNVHLYVVATGLGGWSASRVIQLMSRDNGERFVVRRVLPLAPFMNTSVLVRANPLALADGGWLLPAYFELGNKYPMVISFDRQGEPRWLRRIGTAVTSLQPALMAVSPTEIRALMRDFGPQHRVQQAVSHDSGASWTDLPATPLVNNDSSVAALRLTGGGFVMARNEGVPGPGPSRQWLRLSTSIDGEHWGPAHDVRRGEAGDEFSYPSLVQVGEQLHLSYTLQRRAIAHEVYDIRYLPGKS